MTNICAVRLVSLIFQLPTQSLRFNLVWSFRLRLFYPKFIESYRFECKLVLNHLNSALKVVVLEIVISISYVLVQTSTQ